MTVVVGYPRRQGRLRQRCTWPSVRRGRSTPRSSVATIVPKPWPTPSLRPRRCRVRAMGASSWPPTRRRRPSGTSAPWPTGSRSPTATARTGRCRVGLIEVVEEVNAEILVLGSLPSARRAQVVIGSTADWLLHSSPVPVAVSPRGYRSRAGRLTRITCGYSATSDSADVVRRCSDLAKRFGVPLRVITFAARGRTMYPPEVGLHAEASVLEAWAAQAREMLEKLKTDGIVGEDVVLQVVTGKWLAAGARRGGLGGRRDPGIGHLTAWRYRQGLPRLAQRQDHPPQPGAGAGSCPASARRVRCLGRASRAGLSVANSQF